ncbi:FtsW/RodA/SpoVE family cell cycle protein [uncultured Phocaeicola sp.]|jgi:cell division protein FtsW|uniref:FtsW/RodA/SpoVE family cell cycle protein n=1 Tax=uncultured Phocaeicola sp. TaxID=990718 RepID=UPI0025F6C1AF|nr:FtsW/RodA/SpoVE family cell cycle protein [uncultured Phocaeicola sp.]
MDLLKNLFKGDKVVWIIYLLLCLISIIEVFSASSTLTYKSGDHWGPITTHMLLLMTGTVVVIVAHNIPTRWFKAFNALLPLSWLMLIAVFVIGALTNGAKRWIDLGFFRFQPSEVAKMATIITTAYILSRLQEEDGANKRAFKYILWITGITCALIFTENLSTALLLAGSVVLLMFIGRVPFKQLGSLVGVAIGFLLLCVTVIEKVPSQTWDDIGLHRMTTWQSRLDNYFNKEEIPAAKFDIDKDAQIAHANIAIASSHILGKGPGNSVQRDFLSQAFSDFIYAIIIEELGLVGGACVALLYILLLTRIAKIVRKCDNAYFSLMIIGFGILIVLQAMFNMLVAVGIIPVTGQPLPMISKGGTSTLINSAYIGLILAVSRYVDTQEEKRKEEEEKQAEVHAAAVNLLQQAVELGQQAPGTMDSESTIPETTRKDV